MDGTEAVNSEKTEPVVVAQGTARVQELASGTHTFAVEKELRDRPEYTYVKGELVLVKVMSDGELKIKHLADT